MANHVTGVTSQATVNPEEQKVDPIVEQISQSDKTTLSPIPPTPAASPALVIPAAPQKGVPISVGLDIGTMNILASRQRGNSVETKRIRNVFIDLSEEQVKMLKLSGETSFFKKDGKCYILGDDAANIANIFGRKLRAPMHKGVISPGEIEAMEILKIMVGEVLGQAPEGGICYVSSPGDPIDNDFDTLYHSAVITDIVESYGWSVSTASESTAMAYSECASSDFTGLCISFGHGMTNVSLVFRSIETIKFSVSRGGSWLDEQTARVTNKTPAQICAIKEKGIDLLNPVGKEQQALTVYYKHFIKYVIHHFIQNFREVRGNIELPDKIPCVLAGGSSQPKCFVELVKQAINQEQGFPFPISDVILSDNALESVSLGLLIMAQNH